MSEKEYEAFERFSIMTIDGGLDDEAAIQKVKKQFGRDIAIKVWGIIKLNDRA